MSTANIGPAEQTTTGAPQTQIVIMGVCGSGKTTVAGILADRIDCQVAEADDFHPRANVEKMASGTPLTDEDRWPWLRSLRDWMNERAAAGQSAIITCSALKRSYRDVLRECHAPVVFIHLDGSRELLAQRLAARTNHFMPPGLLDSQLETLEPLEDDEDGHVIDIGPTPQQITTEVMRVLHLSGARFAPASPAGASGASAAGRSSQTGPDGLSAADTDRDRQVAAETIRADIGVYGLGVMGTSLARNLARRGFQVAVYNRDSSVTEDFMATYSAEGDFIACSSEAAFAAALTPPRVAALMVTAGAVTTKVTEQLADRFEEGDIIIDMGNSFFADTREREAAMRERGIHFVGCGTSGGEAGALLGPSLMVGGSEHAYRRLEPMFTAIAARAGDDEPCCAHVGTDGAGHFVKMVHNGIEYADMQLIAEAYALLRSLGLPVEDIARIFADWNTGELGSYLIDITAQILAHPGEGGEGGEGGEWAFVDLVADRAGQKGTGAWTVQEAAALGVPATAIAQATSARMVSSATQHREAIASALGALDAPGENGAATPADASPARPGAPTPALDEQVENIRRALFAAKIVAYSQGLDVIRAGAKAYGWDVDLAQVARLWRAGCIIRADFLDDVARAWADDPELAALVAAPGFAAKVADYQDAWRQVAKLAIERGVPTPALSDTLHYLTAMRTTSLSTALIQAQRDFFGAHTYERRDRPGRFHTKWEEPGRPEIEV